MKKRLLLGTLALILLVGCAKEPGVKVELKELKVKLKNVAVRLGAEKILSDKLLMARKLVQTESKSGWLQLMGRGEGTKVEPLEVPADVLFALVPKADLTVTFEVTNPNEFDVVVGSVSFGLSEETIIFFPPQSETAEVWINVAARGTKKFDVVMTILKIPSLTAIAWPAIESGKAEWKARGTMVVISEQIPSGGMRQEFETGKVGTTMVKSKKT